MTVIVDVVTPSSATLLGLGLTVDRVLLIGKGRVEDDHGCIRDCDAVRRVRGGVGHRLGMGVLDREGDHAAGVGDPAGRRDSRLPSPLAQGDGLVGYRVVIGIQKVTVTVVVVTPSSATLPSVGLTVEFAALTVPGVKVTTAVSVISDPIGKVNGAVRDGLRHAVAHREGDDTAAVGNAAGRRYRRIPHSLTQHHRLVGHGDAIGVQEGHRDRGSRASIRERRCSGL